jgi:glycosyltransferase involved in cell wall biosynthesis
VIDGGSSDGTAEIINKYSNKINYSVSESDKGIYDAMNKAVKHSNGDFVNYINAGDVFYKKDSLENMVKNVVDLSSIYFGRAKVVSDKSYWLYPSIKIKNYDLWLEKNLPNHQSILFPKSFYMYFFYDLRLKIVGDDDYKLFALESCDVKFVDQIFVEFSRDGVSSNHKSFSLFIQRVRESVIINLKHKRYVRLLIDPLKRLLTFFIHRFFGDQVFLKFIKKIKKL